MTIERAQPLERAWLALASAALVAAALCALIVAGARTPWVGAALGLHGWFAPALVVHVVLATIVWLLGVGAAQWVALAPMPRTLGWAVFMAAALGTLALPAALATGAAAQLNNYLPLLDHVLFRAGLAWFALALFAVAAMATLAALRGRGEPDATAFALRCALLPVWVTATVLALAWAALGAASAREVGERLFWAPGHALQFVFTALMVAAWIRLSQATATRALRIALLLTALPALLALVPFARFAANGAEFTRFFTLLMALGSWPGPLLAALLVIRSAPPIARLSIALFALGACVGALIDADTTTVPAHYHGTVGAATLASLGVACSRLGIARARRDALQWLYFGGFALIVTGLAIAGGASAPRKLPVADGPTAIAGLALMSLGAAAAIAGVLWFGVRVVRAFSARTSPLPARIDRRPQALAATVLSVAVLGGVIAWSGGSAGSAPAQPQAAEVRLRFDQGVVMLHARQYDHAVTAFHRVLALAPQMPEAYVNLGFALLGLKRHREAGDFFAAAIELRRDQINAYYGLAVALEADGDLRGAIGAMRAYVHRASAADPYRRKAAAALWEWETQLAQAR